MGASRLRVKVKILNILTAIQSTHTQHPNDKLLLLLYRVIKKSLCTWWLQYRKLQVMFKVSPASLHRFIDRTNCVLEDRIQYSTVHIPNVFCDGHLQIINLVGIVRIHWVRCREIFDHPVLVMLPKFISAQANQFAHAVKIWGFVWFSQWTLRLWRSSHPR